MIGFSSISCGRATAAAAIETNRLVCGRPRRQHRVYAAQRNSSKTAEITSDHIGRRQWIVAMGVGWWCLPNTTLAAEEGVVTYIDVRSNPDLSARESTAILNNMKIQAQNQVPSDFPTFVRDGFDVKIIADGYMEDENGLIFKDFVEGTGEFPQENEQVTFDYTGYNENGARIDSTYRRGAPAEVRLGSGNLIPGFELALKSMKTGGKRRIIIPPALGPPVGPSTFFSAKQCEVFDVELRGAKPCRQQQIGMLSRVVCE